MTSATFAHFLFYFLFLKFWEFPEPDFFPELREYRSTDSASFGEACVTTRSLGRVSRTYREGSAPLTTPSTAYLPNFLRRRAATYQRARTLALDRRRRILLRSDFSEHTWLRAPSETDLLVLVRLQPPRQQRLRRYRLWSALTLAQCRRSSAQGQEGGDTSSLARCHQGKAGTPWQESRVTANTT